MLVTVIIPVLNENGHIGETLRSLESQEGEFEILVVDAGSEDGTQETVQNFPSARLISSWPRKGRAVQMNQGASLARGQTLLFMHADMELPVDAIKFVVSACGPHARHGGGFLKRYKPEPLWLKPYRMTLNLLRTRVLHNLVGTNALFVRRDTFFRIGGFPEVSLLEDVFFCDKLKREGPLAILPGPVRVSSRKYLKEGTLRALFRAGLTLFLYRCLKWPPERLVAIYRGREGIGQSGRA